MKKIAICTLLIVAFCLGVFSQEMTVYLPPFIDVTPEDWFYTEVNEAYEKGFVKGRDGAEFDPHGSVTVAETIAFAARLHAAKNSVQVEFDESIGDVWHVVYVTYAMGIGIINYNDFESFDRPATRREAAYIIDGALERKGGENMQIVIPDVARNEKYADSIYRLYSLGVFKGTDANGSFLPENSITRAEVAAVVLRAIEN